MEGIFVADAEVWSMIPWFIGWEGLTMEGKIELRGLMCRK